MSVPSGPWNDCDNADAACHQLLLRLLVCRKQTDAQIKALKSQDLRHVQLQSRKRRKVTIITAGGLIAVLLCAMPALVTAVKARLVSHTTRLNACSAPGMQDLQRLQESLHFIGAPAASSRTVFVDGSEALQSTAAQQELGGPPEHSAAAINDSGNGAAVADRAAARQAKRRVTAYRQLLEARDEAERVEQLAARLRAAKVAASNGRRRKQPAGSGGGLAAVPQFKRVRQR